MNTQSQSEPAPDFQTKLDALIATLAKGIPNDPKPATTRALLAYLRVLRTCGHEEMYDSIMHNLYASLAALKVDQGSTEAGVTGLTLMFEKCAYSFLSLANATKGTPK